MKCGLISARTVQRGALYALLFCLPFSKAAIEISFPFLLFGWIAEHAPVRWRGSVWRGRALRVCLFALAAYLGICALSILTSTYPRLSLHGFINKTLEYALMFVIAADVASDPAVCRRAVAVMTVSVVLVICWGLAQEIFATNQDVMSRAWWHTLGPGRSSPLAWHEFALKYQGPFWHYQRMTGPYSNPIDLSTYLMVMFPVMWFGAGPPGRARRWLRRLLGLAVAACLIRARSQGAWLALAGGLIVVAVVCRPRIRMAVLVGGLALVGTGLMIPQDSRLGTQLRQEWVDAGFQDRLVMWQAALRMIQDRPLTGQGLNTFMANYLKYWVGGERQPRYAHNCFLQIAAETGVVSLLAFLTWLGAMGALWRRAIGRAPPRLTEPAQLRAMVLGLGAGLTAFLLQSAIDTNFYSLRQAALFWTLAGLLTGLSVHIMRDGLESA